MFSWCFFFFWWSQQSVHFFFFFFLLSISSQSHHYSMTEIHTGTPYHSCHLMNSSLCKNLIFFCINQQNWKHRFLECWQLPTEPSIIQFRQDIKLHLHLLHFITKTYLYNFDPLKPHFYIVKLGITGVYISFLISAQNIDCGYLLELPHRGSSNEYLQSMFWAEIWKNIRAFYLKTFNFWRWNFLYISIGIFS